MVTVVTAHQMPSQRVKNSPLAKAYCAAPARQTAVSGQDRGDTEGVACGEAALGLEGATDDDPEASEADEAGEPQPRERLAEEWGS